VARLRRWLDPSARSSTLAGIATAALGVLAWDYFHIPPVDHLGDLHSDGLVLLAASAAAIFISTMVDRARSVEERRRQESLARVRMVEAADKERSRVVRDLHDGAQQRLVRTILVLELARISLKDNGSEAGELVEEARQEAQQANVELRELAHGILPSVLNRGLGAAVDSLIPRMTLPLTVDVTDERFPPAVEASAYFVISEALTNAVKHSQAGSAHVSARAESGQLRVEVTDDGIGGARVSGTDGLAGLEDRCSTLGGRLALDSRSGSGTRVSAVLPLPT